MLAPVNLLICAISIVLLFLVADVAAANTTTTTTIISPVILPTPPGPYLTALNVQEMVDTSRPDPYNKSEMYTRLLTSVFKPVPPSECPKVCEAKYMPKATAAAEDKALGTMGIPLFESFYLSGICCGASARGHWPLNQSSAGNTQVAPLLVWSPGFGLSRLQVSLTAQYIASYGYEVITIDHPGDAIITEFPDGEIVRGLFDSNSTAEQRDFVLNVETQDVLFVIDSYSKGACGASRIYGPNKKVGVIAHGAIAAQAMLNDSLNRHPGRIAGGVNLDGRFNGPVLTEGIGQGNKSFLIWVPPSGPENITSWDLWWNITDELDQGDWRRELSIANSKQGTFGDLPLLADASGFRKA